MMLRYGDLEFEMEHIYRLENRAVFDESGLDYLYTHWVIGVQCVFHPAATRSNQVTGDPLSGLLGNDGMVSVRDLWTYMMTPRRQLTLTLGHHIILDSPELAPGSYQNMVCDAKGGPQPLSFRVNAIYGVGRTMMCAFEIETWVVGYNDRSRTPAILSHRWTQTQVMDELNYTTRTVEGTAIFRKDYLESHPDKVVQYPDDFRAKLFHPIPDNMKRENIRVTQSADGTKVDYSFQDVEQPLNLGLYNPVLKLRGNYVKGYENFAFFTIPKRFDTMNIEVFGSRASTMQQLINVCGRVVANFGFSTRFTDAPKLYFQLRWDIDLWERRVGLTVGIYLSGFADQAWTAITRDLRNVAIAGWPTGIPGLATAVTGPNPRPPNASGSRGTYAGRMVTQALHDPSTVPPPPDTFEGKARNFPLYGAGGY